MATLNPRTSAARADALGGARALKSWIPAFGHPTKEAKASNGVRIQFRQEHSVDARSWLFIFVVSPSSQVAEVSKQVAEHA